MHLTPICTIPSTLLDCIPQRPKNPSLPKSKDKPAERIVIRNLLRYNSSEQRLGRLSRASLTAPMTENHTRLSAVILPMMTATSASGFCFSVSVSQPAHKAMEPAARMASMIAKKGTERCIIGGDSSNQDTHKMEVSIHKRRICDLWYWPMRVSMKTKPESVDMLRKGYGQKR